MNLMGKARQLVEKGYPLRVYRDPDSGDWVAEAPDLPGCIGVGDDPEQAVRVCRKFVQGWLEEALQQGRPLPEPSVPVAASGRLLLRMPKSLHARLQARAEIEGTSLNQLIVTLLAQALAARDAETALRAILAEAAAGVWPGGVVGVAQGK